MSLLNLDLIEAIYSDAERELTNDELYREVQSRLSISDNDFKLNLQSKCNKKRSTHQLEYNFVSTQKPFPNDEYFLPTSYNKRARKDNDFTRTGQKTSRNCQSTGT
ncbi:hypothetical protein [Klebsiella pneumoniae]|uniref:Uncharacterized protein n=1 Tax=Klebsiella pneumoniae TaxID=573 RepID=A0A385G0Z5_KLEPN|nr:hypothetical protein [Klebsiella pneumoniae]AXV47756.1 hypothetical protein [Klebsiella pneumoniae]QUR78149.1 hypothetical protein JDE60_29695 [Klebsiella pneumoniae]